MRVVAEQLGDSTPTGSDVAKLTLDSDDFQDGNLPPACICCGGPSCATVQRRFLPTPTWMLILNFLPLGSVWFATQNVHGKVPVCRKHKRRLTLGRRLRFIGLGLIAAVIAASVAALALGGPAAAPLLFLTVLCLVPLVVLLGPIALYIDLTTPRVSSLDASMVTLDAVSPRFAKQVVDQSPQGLATSAEPLPSSEGLPAIILGLGLAFLFLPTALAFTAWGLAHFHREPQLAQNPATKQTPNRPTAAPLLPEADPSDASQVPAESRPADAADAADASVSATAAAAEPLNVAAANFDPVMGTLIPTVAQPSVAADAPASADTPSIAGPKSIVEPLSIADAIATLGRPRDLDQELQTLAWLQDQEIAAEDQAELLEILWQKRGDPERRTAAMRLFCRYASRDQHLDQLRTASQTTEALDQADEYLSLVFGKLREWDDQASIAQLIRLMGSEAKPTATKELLAWGEPAISSVLSLINDRDPSKRDAANELVDVLEIPTTAVIEQCVADLENSAVDNRQVARRLAACKVEADSRGALGRAIAKAITARGVELDPLVEAFKQCATHEHVPEIIDLLSEKQSGKVLDAGRAVAIHLRDPDVYPAVVRLIDVPFGDRRTAEVCREIGSGIEQPLWPYLSNPRRARLVAEILRDIGTPESIRPLVATANRTTDKSVQQACTEAVSTIRQQGQARAKALAEADRGRLAATQTTAAERPSKNDPPATDPPADDPPTLRTWTDRSGQFKRQGELVGVTDTTASIRIEGKVVRIPIAKLSDADQEFLAEQN